MANISWTSSSIHSYFNTSLGNPSYAFGSLYNSLGDASLIKNGTYHKLMNSYFTSVKDSDSSTSSQNTQTTTNKHANTYTYDSKAKTSSTVSNKVLNELLSKEEKKSTITNPVLDDLLGKNDTDNTATEVTDTTEASTKSSTSVDTVNTATTEQTTRKHQNACAYTYDSKGQKTSTVSNKILDELI